MRSTALRTFLSPDIRKGLGIFLTPEKVVRAMVERGAPKESNIVPDPACGSGTFLLETVRFLSSEQSKRSSLTIYGIEKNPKMLLLVDLYLGQQPGLTFQRAWADSLLDLGRPKAPLLGFLPNFVDIILTNPPFSVSVTRDTGILGLFESSNVGSDQEQSQVPSEVLFIEFRSVCFAQEAGSGSYSLGVLLQMRTSPNSDIP